ncbi:MAG: hypothetical protein ABL897_15980 [Hyphomicrobium sp.]
MALRLITSCFSVSLLLLLSALPSRAAVRQCGAVVSSEIVTAPTERDAKKKALDQWRAAALKRGPGFDSWRLAANKSLKCFAKGAAYECVAFGAPCVIDQTPRSPPKGPGDQGQGI